MHTSRAGRLAAVAGLLAALFAAPAAAHAADPVTCPLPPVPSTTQPGYTVADPRCELTGAPFVPLTGADGAPISTVHTGIEDGAGTHHEVDVIVYATGFHASEYLFPMRVTGRDGATLEELWEVGGSRAHRFCMYPGFPNLWSLYGPNTNGGLGPGAFHELVTRYALECIERLVLDGHRAVEPRREAYDAYNADVDARNARRVWSDPRAVGYYWTEHGRSAVMCPFSGPEIFGLLRHAPFDELLLR